MDFEHAYRTIAGLTAETLGLESGQIQKASNFFGLGGTSAQALELCLKIEQALPELFSEDGIDTALIATNPNLEQFVRALISGGAALSMQEGEL